MREECSLEPKEHPSRTLPKKGGWKKVYFVSCTQCTHETKSETQYAHAANKKEGQAPPKFPIHLNSEFFILNSEFPLPLYFAFSTFITGFAMNTASTMQMRVSGIR